MDTIPKIVWRGASSRVEFSDLEVATADEVVVGDDDTCDRGEEDGIGRQISSEVVRGAEKVPWAHYEADESTDVTTAADVEVSWE